MDSEKRKYRKLKNQARRECRQLCRHDNHTSSSLESALHTKKKAWESLIRIHNKLRCQELRVHEKDMQELNNEVFKRNPFLFLKEHVTGKEKMN